MLRTEFFVDFPFLLKISIGNLFHIVIGNKLQNSIKTHLQNLVPDLQLRGACYSLRIDARYETSHLCPVPVAGQRYANIGR